MDGDIDIYELANFAIKIAEKNYPNYKCAEIYIGNSEYLNIEVEENAVKYSEIGKNHGISIRIYRTSNTRITSFINSMSYTFKTPFIGDWAYVPTFTIYFI